MAEEADLPCDAPGTESWEVPGYGTAARRVLEFGGLPVVALLPVLGSIEFGSSPGFWLIVLVWLVVVGALFVVRGRWVALSVTMRADGAVTLRASLRTLQTTVGRFREISETPLGRSEAIAGPLHHGMLQARTRDGSMLLPQGLDVPDFAAALLEQNPRISVEPWLTD